MYIINQHSCKPRIRAHTHKHTPTHTDMHMQTFSQASNTLFVTTRYDDVVAPRSGFTVDRLSWILGRPPLALRSLAHACACSSTLTQTRISHAHDRKKYSSTLTHAHPSARTCARTQIARRAAQCAYSSKCAMDPPRTARPSHGYPATTRCSRWT